MNYTFRRVAAYCGLRLSYYCTAAMLAFTFFILVFTKYRTASPLYILLVLAVAPSLIKSMFFSKQKEKRENPLEFPLFCKKYGYVPVLHQSLNLAYFLLFILFAAWHVSYGTNDELPFFIAILPALLSVLSLAIRILGALGYYLYFRLFPLKAMR